MDREEPKKQLKRIENFIFVPNIILKYELKDGMEPPSVPEDFYSNLKTIEECDSFYEKLGYYRIENIPYTVIDGPDVDYKIVDNRILGDKTH